MGCHPNSPANYHILLETCPPSYPHGFSSAGVWTQTGSSPMSRLARALGTSRGSTAAPRSLSARPTTCKKMNVFTGFPLIQASFPHPSLIFSFLGAGYPRKRTFVRKSIHGGAAGAACSWRYRAAALERSSMILSRTLSRIT